MVLIKLQQCIMKACSYVIPKDALIWLIGKTDNNKISRILTTKEERVLGKMYRGGVGIDFLRLDGYIDFRTDHNSFSTFNMCYIGDLLGKALLAVSLGAYPRFHVLDWEGENYFETYFEPIMSGG